MVKLYLKMLTSLSGSGITVFLFIKYNITQNSCFGFFLFFSWIILFYFNKFNYVIFPIFTLLKQQWLLNS